MAVGLSAYLANAFLDAIGNSVAVPAIADVYLQLHIGDPGDDGTSNQAVETDRVVVNGWSSAGFDLDGQMSSELDTVWYLVAGTETYTHYTAWDASTGGNFLWSDVMTAGLATINENFNIPAGSIRLIFTIAS